MKHKVGDVVQIRSKDAIKERCVEDRKHWFVDEMFIYCGEIAKITQVYSEIYTIDLDSGNCGWQDWMFEPTKEYGGFGVSPQEELDEINKEDDMVNNPSHYIWLKEKCGIEVIDITRHFDFDLGNSLKYIMRAGHKHDSSITDKDKTIQDLEKAIFYLNDEINLIKNNYG